ncbi:MAG: response regulator [Ignavibacteriae bacterium]|nr:response regulator [Ignavibacteriota bacterium]
MHDFKALILAIDDAEDNLVTIKALVGEIAPSAEILLARDGIAGLDVARVTQPNVIFLDIVMPGVSGYEICKRLKADSTTRDIPVVFVTAMRDDKASRIRALECGADGFLHKPFDQVELEAILSAMLKINEAGRRDRDERRVLQELVEERTTELRRAHRATLNLLEDLHRENEARKRSEEYFRRVSAITSDIAYSCSAETKNRYTIVWITGAAERITGYSREYIQDKGCWRFLVVDEDQSMFDANVVSVPAGAKATCELRIHHKDGHIVWLESTVECVTDPASDGATILYGGLTDITERRRVAEELHAAKNRAEHSEKLKDAFIANISHEIRTPLNIILGYTGVIAERFLPLATDGDRSFFDSVRRGGDRLLRTVDMILNVSRLQAGEYTPHPVPIDVSALMRTIALDHQPLAEEKNLILCTADETGPIAVVADEYSLVQAVSNLVHNAIKFTPSGQVILRVFRDALDRVCLSVQDTGIGISEEYLPMLFTRYSQEEMGYTREYEGLGLGMALVKGYLDLNRAEISVESRKGKGSIFTITFTTGADPNVTPVSHPAPHQTYTAPEKRTAPSDKAVVLLVEDDEQTIEFMEVLLGGDFILHTARTAELAWDMLATIPVKLVLMDISLAGHKTGLELTRDIRAHSRIAHIPIIAVTAHAYDTDRAICLEAGCDEFLSKPIRKADLFAKMNALLES